MVRALDSEAGGARSEPGDPVLPVAGVVNGRRSAGRGEEAKLVQRNVVEGWKEDLAEGAVGKRVPELALRTRRRPERHLATGTPHGRCAWASWCLHRGVSIRGGQGG